MSGDQAMMKGQGLHSKMGVTQAVTKTDFDNGSNCSDNDQPFHWRDHDIKEKKKKKKKKSKRDHSGRHKSKKNYYSPNQFPGLSFMGMEDPFESFGANFHGKHGASHFADVLALTSQKNSGSKIFPGFCDHQGHSKFRSKDGQGGYGGPQVGPHTCYAGGSQHHAYPGQYPNGMPPFMFPNPFMMAPFMYGAPFQMGPGQMMHGGLDLQKQRSQKDKKEKQHSGSKEKSKQSSSGRKKEAAPDVEMVAKDGKEPKEKESGKEKPSEGRPDPSSYIEAMHHFFSQAQQHGHMHPYFKNGHMPAHFPQGMPIPFYTMPGMMIPPQYQHQGGNHRSEKHHHSSALHKQFTMPITPNNQQDLFAAEKQLAAHGEGAQKTKPGSKT